MSDASDLTERLDKLIALVSLAFAPQIESARAEARADPVVSAILDFTDEWIASGEVKRRVATVLGVGEKTVQRRIGDLVASSALIESGASANRKIKRTGVI